MIERHVFMEEAGAEGAGGGLPSPTPADTPAVSAPDDWRSSLPPELRDSPTLQDVPDLTTLVKNYEHTKSMVGNSVRVPTGEAGQEAIDAFTAKLLEHKNLPLMRKPDPENPEAMEAVYQALGRPEDVSGYQPPEGADPEAFGALAQKAHALGLSKQQYEALAGEQIAAQSAAMQQLEQTRMDSVAQVKGEWGPAFEEKVGRAAQVAEQLKAPAKLVAAMKEGRVDGETLRFLDTIATQMGAEGTPLAEQLGQVTAETVAELEQKIADRTTRIIKEDLGSADKQRLIDANLVDRQRIIDSRQR